MPGSVIELRTRAELDVMRHAGRVVAATLDAVRTHAAVGMTTRDLDELAGTVIRESGAQPLFLGYHPSWAPYPFPGVVCASVNDAVVHGVPDRSQLRRGDLLSVACGASVDGWCADAAITFGVGTTRAEDAELVGVTEQALADGVAAARPGGRIGDVSWAIGVVGRSAGYGIARLSGGHGVGRRMREAPVVPNEGKPGRGVPLRPGMVLALEPIFFAGGRDDVRDGENGWTLCTGDGSRAAHVEHTVAITDDGPDVLTAP